MAGNGMEDANLKQLMRQAQALARTAQRQLPATTTHARTLEKLLPNYAGYHRDILKEVLAMREAVERTRTACYDLTDAVDSVTKKMTRAQRQIVLKQIKGELKRMPAALKTATEAISKTTDAASKAMQEHVRSNGSDPDKEFIFIIKQLNTVLKICTAVVTRWKRQTG